MTYAAAIGAGAALRPPRTIAEKVGQLFVVSFFGTALQPELHSLLERYRPGGVILYDHNVRSAQQLRALLADVQRVSSLPLLVCTDQEGGSVRMIRHGAPAFPSEASFGLRRSTHRVYVDAVTTAHALRSLGITMDLAPVLDVISNPKSPIGQRSYGSDPHLAARLGVAAIRGYQDHGLAATAKHFIGLGHTSVDSHQALPTVPLTLKELEHRDLIPFRAAIAAGVSTVMVAHVALPRIDPVYRPASLSPVIITELIRRRLGFKGVVITDALTMGAIPQGQQAEAPERALAAGADILLLASYEALPPALVDNAVERVISAVKNRRIPEARLDEAVGRILALKRRYSAGERGSPPSNPITYPSVSRVPS